MFPACCYPVGTLLVFMVTVPPLIFVPASSQVQVGVEFEANTRLQDTTFSFGYHLTLPQANMVFRGEGYCDVWNWWGIWGYMQGGRRLYLASVDSLLQVLLHNLTSVLFPGRPGGQ